MYLRCRCWHRCWSVTIWGTEYTKMPKFKFIRLSGVCQLNLTGAWLMPIILYIFMHTRLADSIHATLCNEEMLSFHYYTNQRKEIQNPNQKQMFLSFICCSIWHFPLSPKSIYCLSMKHVSGYDSEEKQIEKWVRFLLRSLTSRVVLGCLPFFMT